MQIGIIAHVLIINDRQIFMYMLEKNTATETAVDNNNVIISRDEFLDNYEFFNIFGIDKIKNTLNTIPTIEYVWFQR